MQLLILRPHRYYSRAQQRLYIFQPGEVRELPEELGLLLMAAHPDKFSVTEPVMDGETGQEGEALGSVDVLDSADTGMEEPPQDKVVRRSRKPRSVNRDVQSS